MARISVSENGCWIWQGRVAGPGWKTGKGYGCFYLKGRQTSAHRASWVLHNQREIPEGLYVCHSCDVTTCVNPKHLFLGTQFDNMRDAARKGRTKNVNDWSGMKNPKAKLSEEQRQSLQSEIALGSSNQTLARKYGITSVRVGQIRRSL